MLKQNFINNIIYLELSIGMCQNISVFNVKYFHKCFFLLKTFYISNFLQRKILLYIYLKYNSIASLLLEITESFITIFFNVIRSSKFFRMLTIVVIAVHCHKTVIWRARITLAKSGNYSIGRSGLFSHSIAAILNISRAFQQPRVADVVVKGA